jgi:hypothetical protein
MKRAMEEVTLAPPATTEAANTLPDSPGAVTQADTAKAFLLLL